MYAYTYTSLKSRAFRGYYSLSQIISMIYLATSLGKTLKSLYERSLSEVTNSYKKILKFFKKVIHEHILPHNTEVLQKAALACITLRCTSDHLLAPSPTPNSVLEAQININPQIPDKSNSGKKNVHPIKRSTQQTKCHGTQRLHGAQGFMREILKPLLEKQPKSACLFCRLLKHLTRKSLCFPFKRIPKAYSKAVIGFAALDLICSKSLQTWSQLYRTILILYVAQVIM